MLTKQTDALIPPLAPGQRPDNKSLKILAKSIFKEVKQQGYDSKQVVALATELIALVTSELQARE
jgi:hypothetical protein